MNVKAQLEGFLARRYSEPFEHMEIVRSFTLDAYDRYVDLGAIDPDFETELCSGSDERFYQRFTELVVAHELLQVGHAPKILRDSPDFLLIDNGRRIWIEVICPEPTGIHFKDLTWPTSHEVRVRNESYNERELRLTGALKEKAEKLLGRNLDGNTGYLQRGIVETDDVYVIAINHCMLSAPGVPALNGISQRPQAVEIAFAIGPMEVTFDGNSRETVDRRHQHRPYIRKPNGAYISTHTFLDPDFVHISAIWALDIDEWGAIDLYRKGLAVVHNPNARNPLPQGFLPAMSEYVATPIDEEKMKLTRHRGRLAREKTDNL